MWSPLKLWGRTQNKTTLFWRKKAKINLHQNFPIYGIKWVVHWLTNVTFYVNKLFDHPIGARVVLPDFFLRNQGLVCLATGSNGPYTDNLCFFRCLAVHRGTPVKDVEAPAKT
jgi:hypothetical protein